MAMNLQKFSEALLKGEIKMGKAALEDVRKLLRTGNITITELTLQELREILLSGKEVEAYLETYLGLEKVDWVTDDYWVYVVGGRSFNCTPKTKVIVKEDMYDRS